MSLFRSFLRIRPVNDATRTFSKWLLPASSHQRIDRKLPLVREFSFNLPNGTTVIWTPCGDICSKALKYDGWDGYEKNSTRLFYALAEKSEVVFDVGAYLGYFALLGAAARRGNRAFAFEAVPELAEKCKTIALRNSHLEITVVASAVGNKSGCVQLFLSGDPLESDTSTNPDHRPNRARVEVPALQLNEFCSSRGIRRVDLMKIDTETTEPSVLEGASELLAASHPVILCEVLPEARVGELEGFAARHDYEFARIEDSGLRRMSRIHPDPAKKDMNFVFYSEKGRKETLDIIRTRLVSSV